MNTHIYVCACIHTHILLYIFSTSGHITGELGWQCFGTKGLRCPVAVSLGAALLSACVAPASCPSSASGHPCNPSSI